MRKHHDFDEALDLVDYRHHVDRLYERWRGAAAGEEAWRAWRAGRDELFARHPQSPVPPAARSGFSGMPFFPYDPAWRLEVEVTPLEADPVPVDHSGAGASSWKPVGRVEIVGAPAVGSLTLLWLESYGGGLFLPFRDATNGTGTYGGGRYLLDTVKGADHGVVGGDGGRRLVLDFNLAYHPSCVHDPRWSCPLAPPENVLRGPVAAGERLPEHGPA